ncbi:MAG TPA: cytochrome ubiquinol oxidase subunit I [bacterium]
MPSPAARTLAAATAILAPLSGDLSARMVARTQPVKLAAMEAHWETMRGAPLIIGGWPDEQAEVTRWGIEIPYGLSLLAEHHPMAEIPGLKSVPKADRPPVAIVHWAFDLMVGIGTLLAALAVLSAWLAWKRRDVLTRPTFLKVIVLCTPLGMIAIEAGWVVTEVGRQPWIVQGYLRTADAVTPMPWLWIPFTLFSLLYVMLAVIVVVLLRRQVVQSAALYGTYSNR